MRVVESKQMRLGEVAIADIKINPKSRDYLDKLLRGIQHLYQQEEIKNKLFSILESLIPPSVDTSNGRPGMHLWRVFVLAMLRLDLNWDYDRLCHMANHHTLIRQLLGHPDWDNELYELQTVKDNLQLLTPDVLDKINQIVVNSGHGLVKKKARLRIKRTH